jgi:hypothetical protein
MIKLFIACAVMTIASSACDQQASRELGAAPKKIIDKAAKDIDAAQAKAADKIKTAEEAATQTDKDKQP